MSTITYRQAAEAYNVLSDLPARGIDDSTLCDLEDNVLALKPHVEALQSKRQRLARKYASDDDPNEIADEHKEDFQNAVSDLLEQEIEVELHAIPRNAIRQLGLKLGRLASLRPIIE